MSQVAVVSKSPQKLKGGAKLTPAVTEKILALYAETESGVRVAAQLGLSTTTVYKVLREHPAEFESYRRLVRMRVVEAAYKPFFAGLSKILELIQKSNDLKATVSATEKVWRMLAYASAISADNNAIAFAARKPDGAMTQTTNVIDPTAIIAGIKAAREAHETVAPTNGDGNRISALRG